jgi:sugar phosphate isomerase/epimerase
MMRSAITVSLFPQAKGGPFVFSNGLAEACREAAALGFSAIEVFALSADSINRSELHELLRRHRLKISAFGTGAGWIVHKWHLCHADVAIREKARQFIRLFIELAAEFDAPAIVGSMQGRIEPPVERENAVAWLGEALQDLGAHAARNNQPLLYEPLNRYETNVFNRAAEGLRIFAHSRNDQRKNRRRPFHMNIEEASMVEAIAAAKEQIGHVHFADSNRRAAGYGHLGFRTDHSSAAGKLATTAIFRQKFFLCPIL